jgi:hypothetical protein
MDASADPARPVPTVGDDDRARARDAYDRGAAAHLRGDEVTAARELALADAIVPSPVTLQAALEAAIAADDAVLVVLLCDRAERAPNEQALAALAHRARSRFGSRVGHVRVECDAGTACTLALDGAPIEAGREVVVPVGRHVVSIDRAGRSEQRVVRVDPAGAATIAITASAPLVEQSVAPALRRDAPRARRPLGWFIASLAATAAAGGATIGSGVDTAARHTAFVSAGCAGPAHGNCSALANDGAAAELRTNLLGAVTGGLGAVTVVAAALTFRGGDEPRAAVAIGAGVAALRVRLP